MAATKTIPTEQGDDSAYICFKNGNQYELKRAYNNRNSPTIYYENVRMNERGNKY